MNNEQDNSKESLKKLEGFQALLNKPPAKSEVRANQYAGNTLFLPISYVEMTLDELYFGLWETKDFKWQIAGNEIIGSITLRVFHPIAKEWMERTGASATMIRLQKGAAVTDISAKIFNALEMDFPHLKADCLVNAAKSLGKCFGRDLNRVYADIYKPLVTGAAVKNGAITAQVQDDEERAKALLHVNSMLEQARMDDQTLESIANAIANCETPAHIYGLMATIKEYIPESIDPAKQFKERMK